MTGRAGSSLRRLAAASLPLLACAGPGGLACPATAQTAPPRGGQIALDADSLAGAARQIARATGSEIVSLEPVSTRQDRGAAVPGLLVAARRAA